MSELPPPDIHEVRAQLLDTAERLRAMTTELEATAASIDDERYSDLKFAHDLITHAVGESALIATRLTGNKRFMGEPSPAEQPRRLTVVEPDQPPGQD